MVVAPSPNSCTRRWGQEGEGQRAGRTVSKPGSAGTRGPAHDDTVMVRSGRQRVHNGLPTSHGPNPGGAVNCNCTLRGKGAAAGVAASGGCPAHSKPNPRPDHQPGATEQRQTAAAGLQDAAYACRPCRRVAPASTAAAMLAAAHLLLLLLAVQQA